MSANSPQKEPRIGEYTFLGLGLSEIIVDQHGLEVLPVLLGGRVCTPPAPRATVVHHGCGRLTEAVVLVLVHLDGVCEGRVEEEVVVGAEIIGVGYGGIDLFGFRQDGGVHFFAHLDTGLVGV